MSSLKEKIFIITSILYIIYITFPLFATYIHIPIQFVSLGTCVALLYCNNNMLNNTIFKCFAVYIIMLLLYTLTGKSIYVGIGRVANIYKVIIEAANLLPSILMLSSIRCFNYPRKVIGYIVFGSLISVCVSLFIVIGMYGASSFRLSVAEQYHEQTLLLGVPSYTLTHAYVLLIPPLLYAIQRCTKKLKLIMIAVCIFVSYIVVYSYITTCLVMMIYAILFSLVYTDGNTGKTIGKFAAIGFALLIAYLVIDIESILRSLSDFYAGTQVEVKLNDVLEMYYRGSASDSYLAGREDLHEKSLVCFFDNIFFGTSNVDELGGHSQLIDRLGGMGIVACTPYFFMFFYTFKSILMELRERKARFFYVAEIIMVFILMYEKGLFGCEGWMFATIISPMIIYYFRDMQKESK